MFEKTCRLCFKFGRTHKDAHNVATWTVSLAIPEEDGQQTETPMVPATFTKQPSPPI